MSGATGEVLEVALGVERLVDEAQADLEGLAAQMGNQIGVTADRGCQPERLERLVLPRAVEGAAQPRYCDVTRNAAERVAPGRCCRTATRSRPAGGAIKSRLIVLLDVHEPACQRAGWDVEVGRLLHGAGALPS